MRALKRKIGEPFHKVYFHMTGDTPYIWSTEKRMIAAKITRPLMTVITPRKWAKLAHDGTPEDAWLEEEWLL